MSAEHVGSVGSWLPAAAALPRWSSAWPPHRLRLCLRPCRWLCLRRRPRLRSRLLSSLPARAQSCARRGKLAPARQRHNDSNAQATMPKGRCPSSTSFDILPTCRTAPMTERATSNLLPIDVADWRSDAPSPENADENSRVPRYCSPIDWYIVPTVRSNTCVRATCNRRQATGNCLRAHCGLAPACHGVCARASHEKWRTFATGSGGRGGPPRAP